MKEIPLTSFFFTDKETEVPCTQLVQGDLALYDKDPTKLWSAIFLLYCTIFSEYYNLSHQSFWIHADSMNIKTSYSNSLHNMKVQNLQLRFLKNNCR